MAYCKLNGDLKRSVEEREGSRGIAEVERVFVAVLFSFIFSCFYLNLQI